VLREASRRLSIASLLGAALWTIGPILGGVTFSVTHRLRSNWYEVHARDVIAAGGVLVSLALFFYARRRDRDPRFILDLGLGYMVLMAFAMGNLFHWEPVPHGVPVTPMISWIGALVLVFAAMVPSTPGKTLVAGLIAATMNPIGMLIARSRGMWDFGSTTSAFFMHYPDYVLVGFSLAISHVFTRLGEQVTSAREMGSSGAGLSGQEAGGSAAGHAGGRARAGRHRSARVGRGAGGSVVEGESPGLIDQRVASLHSSAARSISAGTSSASSQRSSTSSLAAALNLAR